MFAARWMFGDRTAKSAERMLPVLPCTETGSTSPGGAIRPSFCRLFEGAVVAARVVQVRSEPAIDRSIVLFLPAKIVFVAPSGPSATGTLV